MKHTLLLILSLFIFNVKGQVYQPFPDSNATWTFYDHMVQTDTYTQNYFEIIDHVPLNGYDYMELTNGYLLREENKRIYEWSSNDQAEYLVYDFNLETGDTLTLERPFATLTLIVQAEDSILIGSTYHRVLDFGLVKHIEGVGSTMGPVYWEVLFGADFNFIQTCFTNSTGLYVVQADGSIIPSIVCTNFLNLEEVNSEQANWYIEDNLLLFDDLSENVVQIVIYDLLGKSLITEQLNNTKSININTLNSGVFIGKIILKDNKEFSIKFSKP